MPIEQTLAPQQLDELSLLRWIDDRVVMALSSSGKAEMPWGAPVFFVRSGATLTGSEFFFTSKPDSLHATQFLENAGRAAMAIFDQWQSQAMQDFDWRKIIGVQTAGVVRPLIDSASAALVQELYLQKYPFAGAVGKAFAWYAFKPTELWLTDNRAGVRGRQRVF